MNTDNWEAQEQSARGGRGGVIRVVYLHLPNFLYSTYNAALLPFLGIF